MIVFKISGNSVYFSGVDMIDGTPVLDIKPYIPHYDAPVVLRSNQHVSLFDNGSHQILLDPLTTDREAPDGEETSAYDMPLSPLHTRVQCIILILCHQIDYYLCYIIILCFIQTGQSSSMGHRTTDTTINRRVLLQSPRVFRCVGAQ